MNKTIVPIHSSTLVSEGTRIQGNLTFLSEAQVFSLVEGEILQQSLEPLLIGRTGWVHGSVSSQGPITVEGKIDGNVFSQVSIRVTRTGVIRGALVSPAVQLEPGAQVEGEFLMRWQQKEVPAAKPNSKAHKAAA